MIAATVRTSALTCRRRRSGRQFALRHELHCGAEIARLMPEIADVASAKDGCNALIVVDADIGKSVGFAGIAADHAVATSGGQELERPQTQRPGGNARLARQLAAGGCPELGPESTELRKLIVRWNDHQIVSHSGQPLANILQQYRRIPLGRHTDRLGAHPGR